MWPHGVSVRRRNIFLFASPRLLNQTVSGISIVRCSVDLHFFISNRVAKGQALKMELKILVSSEKKPVFKFR